MDLTNQYELERLFNKNQAIPRIRSEMQVPELLDYLAEHKIPEQFGIDMLTQMVLHKRTTLSTMVGLLWRHFEEEVNPHQACVDMLRKACEIDLLDWDAADQRFVITINIDDETRAEIEQYQFPLPMVVVPAEVKTNRDTGMFTTRGSIILKNNHHEDDVCLDHINRVNRTKLAVNGEVVRLVRNSWADLDHRKEGESEQDFARRTKSFEKYDRVTRDVIDLFLMADAPFHLTHRYDKRGRTYAQGYHINPQGNDWSKAIVELARKEVAA